MTKVIISPLFLEYRQAMASILEQVRREYAIAGVKACSYQEPFVSCADAISSQPGLVRPPGIEIVTGDDHFAIRDGQVDELILFWTWGDFGPLHVAVHLLDEEGKVLESSAALPNETLQNHWGFFIDMEAGDHRSLTLRAIVTDRLGGMGIQTISLPLV
jgi:hypothetical protein